MFPPLNMSFSGSQLKLAVDIIPSAIVYLDHQERYLYGNRYYETRYGRKQSEILGRTMLEVLGPERYKDFEPYVKRVLAGETVQFEMRIPRDETSEPEICFLTYVPDFDENGKLRGFAGVAQDITEHRTALERLSLTMRSAQMGTWHWNIKNGRIVWDERTQTLFGYEPGTFPGTHDAYFAALHPDDREPTLKRFQECLDQKRDFSMEYRSIWPDGSVHWLQSIGRVFYDGKGELGDMHGMVFEITERKLNEEALRFSEAHFESLVNLVPEIVWIYDASGALSFCNRAWYAYSGLNPMADSEERRTATVHPDDLPLSMTAWTRARENHEAFEVELRIRRYDGAYRWFLVKSIPLKDSAGKLIKWFGTSTDIHSSKASELQALALQSLSVSLLRANSRQEVATAVVTGAGRALGTSAIVLLWKNAETLKLEVLASSGLSQDEIASWNAATPGIEPMQRHGAWATMPLSDGRDIVGALSFSFSEPQEFDHNARTYMQIVVDECSQAIARSKLLEEQALYAQKALELQQITSELSRARTESEVLDVIRDRVFSAFHAQSGIFAAPTPTGDALTLQMTRGFSDDFVARFGVTPLDEGTIAAEVYLSRQPIFIESHEGILAQFPKSRLLINHAVAGAIAGLPLNLSDRCLGVILFAYHRDRTFPENTRRLMQALVTHCAEALERARLFDIAEKAVQARDTLISVSAHELLTPVTASKLYLQLIRRKIVDGATIDHEMVRKMVDQTERQLNRLHRLVGDMLDLSRINLGKLTIERRPTNLSRLSKDVLETMSGHFSESNHLTSRIEPDVEGLLDSYRMEQVLANLLTNAQRYGAGNPVDFILTREKRDLVRVDVIDRGIGIKKEDHKRIFERFERAVITQDGAGLGIGLFLVKQIVEAHGGTVALESALGQGSRFTVRLPLT